jgi:hypothetical protein
MFLGGVVVTCGQKLFFPKDLYSTVHTHKIVLTMLILILLLVST